MHHFQTSQGWDRARPADGSLGSESLDGERAKDVSVRLCEQSYTPTRLWAGPRAEAALAFAALAPWTPDGTQGAIELLGGHSHLEWRSWGPHDFVDGSADG